MIDRKVLAAVMGTGALLLALAAVPSRDARAAERDLAHAITDEIICPCSCGEVLTGCTCETGISMKGYVENEVKAGKDKEEIMTALVSQYGEVIRGAPKAKGFNLIVWVAPFAATLLGFAMAAWILQRWVRRRSAVPAGAVPSGSVAPGAAAPSSAEADLEALRARAEAELRRLRGA